MKLFFAAWLLIMTVGTLLVVLNPPAHWTGEPHGRTYECTPLDGSATTLVTEKPPDELRARRAVPLPIGLLREGSSRWLGLLCDRS